MIRSLKFFLLLSLFLILTTFNSNKEKNYKSIFFKIKNINIENTKVVELVELKRDLEFLKGISLLFLDEVKVIDVIKNGNQRNKWLFILNTVSTSAITGIERKYEVKARPIPINNGPIISNKK